MTEVGLREIDYKLWVAVQVHLAGAFHSSGVAEEVLACAEVPDSHRQVRKGLMERMGWMVACWSVGHMDSQIELALQRYRVLELGAL